MLSYGHATPGVSAKKAIVPRWIRVRALLPAPKGYYWRLLEGFSYKWCVADAPGGDSKSAKRMK